MATTSYYLDCRRKAAGKPGDLTVVLRHNNESAFFTVENVHVFPNEWTGSEIVNRPDARVLNIVTAKFKADIDAAIFSLSFSRNLAGMTAAQVKDAVIDSLYPGQPRSAKGRDEQKKELFVPYFIRFAEHRNKQGTTDLYLQTLKKIRSFQPDVDTFTFEDFSKNWLEDFDTWLKETNSPNIRNRQLRNIRAVFNDAFRSKATQNDPFYGFTMPKLEQTRKRALTINQLKELRDYPCMEWQREYVDIFMLSFYLIGINMVDLLTAKKTDVRNGRLEYRREKTGRLYSVKIEPEAQEIIDRYAGKEWLLNIMDRYQFHKNYTLRMDKALKKIGLHYTTSSKKQGAALFPDLSTYWARHTWATIASGHAWIPIETIARALGHGWVFNNITAIYIDFDNRKVDEANRKVLDLLR